MGTELEKSSIGRPLKFKSPEEMEEKGLAYFKECERKKLPLTITGLAIALGTTRELLCNYEERDVFRDTIKRLKTIVENYLEQRAITASNPAGAIFILKASFKYRDTVDIKFDGSLRPSQYSPEEEAELREFARLRALDATKALTTGGTEE